MAVNKGEIGIYGVLRRDGGDNILARTDQIQDVKTNKTQEQLNLEALNKAAIAAAHIANTENPHSVSKSQVGLGNVSNDALVKRTEMGKPLGVATLDGLGRVLSSQLPSYVDDVLEYSNKSAFPTTGETGKIYVDTTTNLTYRWSGSQYVEISQSLALGETSSTAYSGDKGKATTDKVNTHVANTGNPHNVTKAQVGLSNVDNTSDLNKPISTAVQTALDGKLSTSITTMPNPNPIKVQVKEVNLIEYDGSAVKTINLTSSDNITITSSGSTITIGGGTYSEATNTRNGLMSSTDKDKLDNIESGAQVNSITGVKGNAEGSYRTGNVNITPTNIGLGNVNNTSDLDKPISNATLTALDNKANINDLSNILAEEVLDESNFPEVNTYTREELKKDLFIDMWNTACGSYGRYNATTGFFELNGLTDITYEEALKIDSFGAMTGNIGQRYSGNLGVRTFYPLLKANILINCTEAFFLNTSVEVINGAQIKTSGLSNTFSDCTNLRSIQEIDVVGNQIGANTFKNCSKLENLKISRVKSNFNVQWCPKLTSSSFLHIINKAINEIAITITVHPDVYAKLTDETNTEWHAVLTAAAAKNISFATV